MLSKDPFSKCFLYFTLTGSWGSITLAVLPCGGNKPWHTSGMWPWLHWLQPAELGPAPSQQLSRCPHLPSMLRSHQQGKNAGKNPAEWVKAFVTPEATIYCGVPGMLLCAQTAPWPSCLDAAVTGTETSMPLLQHWLVAKAGTSPCQWAGCHMNRWKAAQPCQGSGWLHPRSSSTGVGSITPASSRCQCAWLKIFNWA